MIKVKLIIVIALVPVSIIVLKLAVFTVKAEESSEDVLTEVVVMKSVKTVLYQ